MHTVCTVWHAILMQEETQREVLFSGSLIAEVHKTGEIRGVVMNSVVRVDADAPGLPL